MNRSDGVIEQPNPTVFTDKLNDKIENENMVPFAVILIAVSKMNYIYHTYGLEIGNVIMKEVGYRIKVVIGCEGEVVKCDTGLFGILYTGGNNKDLICKKIESIFSVLALPIKIEGNEVYIEANGAGVRYPDDGNTAMRILNRANVTLEKVKELNGKSQYLFYEQSMQEAIQKQIRLESDMHGAYKNNEFIVYYQPSMDLKKKGIIGMEALLRRRKVTGEIEPPGKFIELLEQMELIEQVGRQVVEEVCKQLREWLNKGHRIVPVAINLSSIQFRNKNMVDDIVNLVKKYDIPAQMIMLEITETVAMQDIECTKKMIQQLKNHGFTIAIDDFGTGYSSLGYLKKFVFDDLKIDISFIREVVENHQDRAIVAAIISIAKALNMRTVAEGIETKEQLELMSFLGCEVGQGYYWDAPMPANEIEKKYFMA